MNAYDVGDLVILEAAFSIDAVTVTVAAPGAADGETTVPVEPLTGGIPSGAVLSFDTPLSVTLTAPANIGATSLAVSALSDDLDPGDEATFPGGATDPTDVTFEIQPRGEDATVYEYGADVELLRSGVGAYAVAWLITDPGFHEYRFVGEGEVQQAQGARFYARPSNVTVTA